MAANDKKASEKAQARMKLHLLNGKINSANNVITALNSYKVNIDSSILSWETERGKLKGNYLSVKATDIFQGEMANKLNTDMSKVSQNINLGITDAGELSSAIQTQISALQRYVSTLETQKSVCTTIINS